MDKNECAKYHIIGFTKEGTVTRAIFDDDINKFQELFNSLPDERLSFIAHDKSVFFFKDFPTA